MVELKRAWDMDNIRYVSILLIAEKDHSLAEFVEGFIKTIFRRVTTSENTGNREGQLKCENLPMFLCILRGVELTLSLYKAQTNSNSSVKSFPFIDFSNELSTLLY